MTVSLLYDFSDGAQGWLGLPRAGLTICSNSMGWVSQTQCSQTGIMVMVGSCENSGQFVCEIHVELSATPYIYFDEIKIEIHADHAYPPPGGNNTFIQVLTSPDGLSRTTQATHNFTVSSDDEEIACQTITLNPTGVVGDLVTHILYRVWGSSDTINDDDVEAEIMSIEFVKSAELQESAGGIPGSII